MVWIGADFSGQSARSALLAEKPALSAGTIRHALPVYREIDANGCRAFDVSGHARVKAVITHSVLPNNLPKPLLDFLDVAHTFGEILRGNFYTSIHILRLLFR